MLNNTSAVIDNIISGFRKTIFSLTLITQLILIGYLGYSIYIGKGFFVANIILIVLSVFYFVFYILTRNLNSRDGKNVKKYTKRIVAYSKLIVNAGTLGALLYSTVVATGDIGAIDIILLALSFIVWFLQVIIQIATVVIESQLGILKLALEMDVEAMIRPVTAVGDAIKKIAGKDTSAQPKPPAQEKLRKKIAELGAAYKKEKQEKRKIAIFFKKKDKAQGVSEKSGQTSEDISSEKEKIANK